MSSLAQTDPEIANLIAAEEKRLRDSLVMIASENAASEAVLTAQGSVFTNKYAEGYPGKRYYGGCENLDLVENLAIERVKKIFGAEHANVQPHSGSQANMAAYMALINVGDTIMGLNLASGGHLTHGHGVNFSGRLFKVAAYEVNRETEQIDYDELLVSAKKHRPQLIIAGASAYPRQIDFNRFRAVADEVGAFLLVDMAHIAGLIAAGLHPNPIPVADVVTSTTHKTLRGPRGGLILSKEKFAKAVDKNVFPGMQGGPLGHVIAAKAVCFKEALSPSFIDYQKQIIKNAHVLAEELGEKYGYRLVAGGTDTHLLLVDVLSKGLTGQEAENMLSEVGIVVNKNAIPFDSKPPAVTSGIRIGTPALTTRGMKESEMRTIAEIIAKVLSDNSAETKKWAKSTVQELCSSFPIFF